MSYCKGPAAVLSGPPDGAGDGGGHPGASGVLPGLPGRPGRHGGGPGGGKGAAAEAELSEAVPLAAAAGGCLIRGGDTAVPGGAVPGRILLRSHQHGRDRGANPRGPGIQFPCRISPGRRGGCAGNHNSKGPDVHPVSNRAKRNIQAAGPLRIPAGDLRQIPVPAKPQRGLSPDHHQPYGDRQAAVPGNLRRQLAGGGRKLRRIPRISPAQLRRGRGYPAGYQHADARL